MAESTKFYAYRVTSDNLPEFLGETRRADEMGATWAVIRVEPLDSGGFMVVLRRWRESPAAEAILERLAQKKAPSRARRRGGRSDSNQSELAHQLDHRAQGKDAPEDARDWLGWLDHGDHGGNQHAGDEKQDGKL